jgi:Tol biopolymer transport system component
LCPACLIKLGMSDPNWTPPPETPPEIPAAAPSATTVASRRFSRLPRLPVSVWIAAGALLALLYVFSRFLMPPGPGYGNPSGPIIRFTIALPDEVELADGAQFAVSPDGRQIVAVARDPNGRQQLWVRSLASSEWRELRQSDGASHPFWSPDSRQVGFFADRRLKRTDVASGLTVVVCDAPSGRGGAWTADGVIIFAPGSGPLMRVAAAGGTPEQVTTVDGPRGAHAWPGVLPDPQRFVYSASAGIGEKNESPALALSMDTGESRVIVQNGWSAAFARGYLFFVQGTSLIAQPFDARRLEATGDVRRVPGADEVGGSPSEGAAFSVSNDVLVYRAGRPTLSQLLWFDRRGEMIANAHEPGDYWQFSLSPDGSRVAVARLDPRDGSSNIWLLDPRRGIDSRATLGRSRDAFPVWSPDARRIAFASDRGGSVGIYVTAADGGGKEEQLLSLQEPARPIPTDWSHDGRALLYSAASPKTASDLLMLPLDGERKALPIVNGAFNESDGRFSPDVRYVAYVSDESGRNEVYVQTFPPAEGKWQISAGGGTRPRWRRDGRELFFLSPDGMLMSVEIQKTASAPQLGPPRMLLPLHGADDYEISPDGQRILAKAKFRERGDNDLQVVLNWAAELAGSR